MLTLRQVKEGDDTGLFVVGRIFGEDFVHVFVILLGEIKVGFWGVVGCVDVLLNNE